MSERPIKILLIEDNPGDVSLLKARLEEQLREIAIDSAGTLAEGAKRLAGGGYDVLLLDLGLPDSLRHETLPRAVAAAGDVPIVVLTGSADESVGVEAVQLGAQDYLVKDHAEGPQIARSIRYAMERKKVESQLRRAHDELEQRVAERTSQLQRTLDELHKEYRQRVRLEREIVKIGEMERQRIGRDLHDMLGSKLTGVAFLSKAMEKRLETAKRPEAKDAAAITALLNEAVAQTRALARGLRQVEFRKGDLEKALRDMLDDMQQVFHVECELEMELPAGFENPAQASHLYHIISESVTNAVKHAGPSRIRIKIGSHNGSGVLTVTNDGKPLPGDYLLSKGMGIQTMQYRAKIIGGQLELRPAPDGGTVVTCTFPLTAQA